MMRVTEMRAGMLAGTVTVPQMPVERSTVVVSGVRAVVSFRFRLAGDRARACGFCGHGVDGHASAFQLVNGTYRYVVACPACAGNECKAFGR